MRRNRNRRDSNNKRKIANAVGKPWDWAFMIDVEIAKLQTMLKYFEKSNITEDNPIIVRDIKLAINLAKVIDTEGFLANYKGVPKVNTKNLKRFTKLDEKLIFERRDMKEYYLSIVRFEKAWYLYHQLRFNKMRSWWD